MPSTNRTSSYNLAYLVPMARGRILLGHCLLPPQHGLWLLQEAHAPPRRPAAAPTVVVFLGGNSSSHGRQLLAFGAQRQLFDPLPQVGQDRVLLRRFTRALRSTLVDCQQLDKRLLIPYKRYPIFQ